MMRQIFFSLIQHLTTKKRNSTSLSRK